MKNQIVTNMQAVRINTVWIRWCWSFVFRQPYQVMHDPAVWLGLGELKLMYGKNHAKLFPKVWERGTGKNGGRRI